jgi:hypothetical protein
MFRLETSTFQAAPINPARLLGFAFLRLRKYYGPTAPRYVGLSRRAASPHSNSRPEPFLTMNPLKNCQALESKRPPSPTACAMGGLRAELLPQFCSAKSAPTASLALRRSPLTSKAIAQNRAHKVKPRAPLLRLGVAPQAAHTKGGLNPI